MFVAKFTQVNSDAFTADKNGNMPYTGEILAGSSKGSIINGTMFKRNGLEENKLYACENFIDDEYPDNQQTRIVAEVSVVDFMELRTKLGAPKNNYGSTVEETTEEPVFVEAEGEVIEDLED